MEISLSIKNIDGNKAILLSEKKEEIIWPVSKLPDNIKEGQLLHFSVLSDEEFEKEKNKQAKDIINEILDV
jgi:hypothetical protein